MLTILDVLAVPDNTTDEDFWKIQNYVEIPEVMRPKSFLDLISESKTSLQGKCIAIPKMFIGEHDPKAKPVATSQDVIELWKQSRKDLETLGAKVIETDFPLVTNYEDESVTGQPNNVVGFKPDWNGKERGELVAYLWDDFLKATGDPKFPDGLASADGHQMFPRPQGLVSDRYMETRNFMNYPGQVELAKKRNGKSIWEIDGIADALPALEAQRKRDFEDWMDKQGIDLVVFPANGDVGKADVDTNDESAKHALQNGVRYSNGNRAIRHMGVPTVSVTMGLMGNSKMPVNLTFAGRHGQDSDLLKYAYAFEQHTKRRVEPPVTPALESDRLDVGAGSPDQSISKPSSLEFRDVTAKKTSRDQVLVEGSIAAATSSNVKIEAFVDGRRIPGSAISISNGTWSIEAAFTSFAPPKPLYGGVGEVVGNVNIVVLARLGEQVAGRLVQVPQNAETE
jgi:Asp-tRNA(Asn)/Glu-tRNA(Gln) amidotransferase A subunit family amidase